MFKSLKIFLMSLAFVFVSSLSFAQLTEPGDGAGGDPNGSGTPVGGGAPIGSGLALMVAFGLAYSGKKIYHTNFSNK